MATESYLENSIASLRMIDIESLQTITPTHEIGRGGSFASYSIGNVATSEMVALKYPIKSYWRSEPESAWHRLVWDMTLTQFLTQQNPDLTPLFPSFLGIVSTPSNSDGVAVITEDATRNGELSIASTPLSEATQAMLAKVVQINEFACEESAGFMVGKTTEKILDLSPSPVDIGIASKDPAYYDAYQEVYERRRELTITVPESSPIASFQAD